MGISIRTRKMLWGRSANRCNFPECKRELVMDATETDDESIVGEECHIVARETDGPRGNSDLTGEQRDKYNNLLLLCNVHHKLIDDQPNKYTVDALKEMKSHHEQWVKSALNFDEQKQRDDEVYSTYIEEWCRLVDIDNWDVWSSWVLGSGQPHISIEVNNNLEQLKIWLLSRIWPKCYPELDSAFENFRRVLEDFYALFHEHARERGGIFETEKFYKIRGWDEELHSRLHKEFVFHVDLVEDLMLELTRAANYICDKIRKFIIPSFRLKDGMLLVTYGPCMDLSFRTIRTEYRGEERIIIPYLGLEDFKKTRKNRDHHFGKGQNPQDPEFLALMNS